MEWYYVVGLSAILFYLGLLRGSRYPSKLIDKGHRFFAAKDEKAQKIIVEILKDNGLKPWKTFKVGFTTQVIMDDKETVIGCFSEDVGNKPKHVISMAVKNPENAVQRAWEKSFNNVYEAKVERPLGIETPFHLLKTELFLEGGGIAFRKHIFKMPKPHWIKNP
jgi:hypothetical protein